MVVTGIYVTIAVAYLALAVMDQMPKGFPNDLAKVTRPRRRSSRTFETRRAITSNH